MFKERSSVIFYIVAGAVMLLLSGIVTLYGDSRVFDALNEIANDGNAAQVEELRKLLTMGMWMIVAIVTIGLLMYICTITEISARFYTPLRRIMSVLHRISENPASNLRLPLQEIPFADRMASLFNNILDMHDEQCDDANNCVIRGYDATNLVLNTIEAPAILCTGGFELFAQNDVAKEFFSGDGGHSIYQHFLDAAKSGCGEFESHGVEYTIEHPEPKRPSYLQLFIIHKK